MRAKIAKGQRVIGAFVKNKDSPLDIDKRNGTSTITRESSMGIDELLSKLKLVDIKAEFKPEGEQVGIVNVKNVEANQTVNYHFHVSDPETARALGEGITGKLAELEMRAKEGARHRLESIEPVIDFLPASSQTDVASAAVGLAAAEEVFGTGRITLPVPKVRGTAHTVVMCKGCGTSVDIESNYCSKCGEKLR